MHRLSWDGEFWTIYLICVRSPHSRFPLAVTWQKLLTSIWRISDMVCCILANYCDCFLIVFAFDQCWRPHGTSGIRLSLGTRVIFGANFGTKVDVWALGCIISSIWYSSYNADSWSAFCNRHSNFWPALTYWTEEWSRRWSFGKNNGADLREFSASLPERSGFEVDTWMVLVREFVQTSGNSADLNFYSGKSTPYWWIDTGEHRRCIANYGVKDIGPTSQFVRDYLCFDPDERLSIQDSSMLGWTCIRLLLLIAIYCVSRKLFKTNEYGIKLQLLR